MIALNILSFHEQFIKLWFWLDALHCLWL